MKRVRVAIVGAGTRTEWGVVPVLSGPDIASPPDSGAWWARRADASSSAEIRYQPPALPEIVALCDKDRNRASRVAQMARVRAVYSDWRVMLREVECDAVVCVASDEAAEIALALPPHCRLWLDGLPSHSTENAQHLETRLRARIDKIWCAHTARQSAAHRAARQLVEREQIGAVSAIALRWGVPFAATDEGEMASQDDKARLNSSLAALDLALSFAGLSSKSSTRSASFLAGQVWARERNGATNVMLETENVTATLLFAGGESWSAPLPRLEIVGTQGRFLVCESGRRLWLHHPREAARFWEPPGLSHHVSSANISGLAEELKEFLTWCVAPENEAHALLDKAGASWASSSNTLFVLDAASRALRDNVIIGWNAPTSSTRKVADYEKKSAPVQPTLALPL